MGTTSSVTSYPALADGEGAIARGRHVPGRSRSRGRTVRTETINQSNPLDTIAQSYQGGALVTLDFTPEEERPKAAHSTCPTTT